MKQLNMHEAKTNLSRVVEEIEHTGETYLICRDGKPVAELRGYVPRRDVFDVDPQLSVQFHEDPTAPLDPSDWPEAFA